MNHINNEDLNLIASVIQEMTGVAGLEPERDFYDAGVTSVQALPLLLELEARFAVAIPDEQFIQSRTTRALESMIRQLRQA